MDAPNLSLVKNETLEGHALVRALYAPFPVEDHEVRELRKTRNGKIQWSVYIRREAITKRLDMLLPFGWEFQHIDPRRETEYVAVKGSLIIKGHTRDNNGAASAKGLDDDGKPIPPDENTEKAAVTDCFKRCASSWGIGLYLQRAPDIYTEGYTKGDFDTKRQREEEALDRVGKWLAPQLAKQEHPISQPVPPPLPDDYPNLRTMLQDIGINGIASIIPQGDLEGMIRVTLTAPRNATWVRKELIKAGIEEGLLGAADKTFFDVKWSESQS